VCEPTLVVKSGKGAPTTATAAEAVAEQRGDANTNGTVSATTNARKKKQI